ncbi:MAG: putative ABC transporter permease [Oscillospiraceae bacterium]|nr:putative ABC transporter permease [Oscillospiraceae bacterium]
MQALPYVNYSLYELFLIFCFWSFIGWCVEVVDMTYETGEYQNRGFLNMPICPIEGFGMVMVILFFRGIKDMIVPLFLASTALCTGFELFMGWGMEKLFHARWWDYSHMKFNFKGYICLRNSLFFGAGCVFCVQLVEPLLENAIHSLPLKIGMGIVIIMAVLIAVDTVSSFSAAINLSRRIRRLDEISRQLLAD